MAETTDIAYTAGFFDGEGCVRLQMNRNGKYGLRVFISQKDRRPLEWVQKRFGGRLSKWKGNVATQLYFFGPEAYTFLQIITPYLIVKKAQCELAIKAYEEGMTAEVAAELSRMKKKELI